MKLFITLIFTTISAFAFAQNSTDCSQVKTGKFRLVSELSGTTIIKRTKKYQIEINEDADYKAKFDIVWKDDCTYELHNKKLIKGPEYLSGKAGNILIVEILWVTEDRMRVKSSSNFAPMKVETEIEIL